MFNIVQVQNQLQNVSNNDLIRYMKNPSPEVPTYLVLSEFQRREQMRKDYVKNNPPTSTVAQDLEQQAAQHQGLSMLAKHPSMQTASVEKAPQSQGVAGLDTGNMFNEQSYATGGIVAFANNENQPVSRNMPDEYGIVMPPGATLDDISMEMQAANKLYGVDPDFYKTQAAELQRQRDELAADKTQAGWMGLARAGLGIAAGKSPYALSNIGEGAIQGITQYGADVKDIKAQDRLLKEANLKLAEAQQAEARGDARTSMKLMDERNNKLLDAQLKRAEIGIKDKIAAAKASGDTAKAEALLKFHAAQLGEQKFVNAYPSGSVSGYLGDNQALTEFIRNRYTKNMEDYLRTGILKAPPKEADLKKEFESLYPKLAAPSSKKEAKAPVADKPVVPSKPPATARPPQINNLLNKYPPQNTSGIIVPQKRNTNTPAELELNRRLEYFNQHPPSEGQADEDEEV